MILKTGFHISDGAGGAVSGRMFLARLPKAWHTAAPEPGVLGQEIERKPGQGPEGDKHAAGARLAGGADLGA
jgi:hypothetical protein